MKITKPEVHFCYKKLSVGILRNWISCFIIKFHYDWNDRWISLDELNWIGFLFPCFHLPMIHINQKTKQTQDRERNVSFFWFFLSFQDIIQSRRQTESNKSVKKMLFFFSISIPFVSLLLCNVIWETHIFNLKNIYIMWKTT